MPVFRSMFFPILALVLLVVSARTARTDDKKESKAISPKQDVIKLFNGKNLDGLYTFLKDTKYDDPRQVFTVEDGMLRISGDGLGAILTKSKYRDYHLVCEFKWGKRTWKGRENKTKDSGILVHCVGPDGSYGGIWPASIEAQIIEGGFGDFILVGGTYADGKKVPLSLTAEVAKDRDGEHIWHSGGEKKTFHGGRINWYGRDPDWKDVIGFRGKEDVESPDGQWTRMDVVCNGGRITNYVNGVKVNEGFDSFPTAGKILIQTELAELWVRRWELWPIGKAPAYKPEKQKRTKK